MAASIVRGVGSVLTVIVAILVTTRVGEAATAKILAAVISAAVLISLEWFVRWSPMHIQWARHRLDERSVWTGVWVQTVVEAWSTEGRETNNRNSFSVFRVVYGGPEAGYTLVGRAYDSGGTEVAEYESTEGATFSKDGKRLSYIWRGKTWEGDGIDPLRTGLATMQLRPGEKDNGTGEVQHVGSNRQLDVEFERVTAAFLRRTGLDGTFDVASLQADEERRRFAEALALARTRLTTSE